MPLTDPQYIIAIGASAGGMEEIHNFFDNTPLDSVSYVIVQHLSPDFRSRMVELLEKHSKLKVTEAEQNMRVEANNVYFIPSKKIMTICDGRLHLKEKIKTGKPHLTVNIFFNSLAAERSDKAIGVILSGTGSDGSEGVIAIKKAGGMVIASNPDQAEYNGMPASAIATGMTDFVLNVELMPQTIMEYVSNKGKIKEVKKVKEVENEEKYMTAIVDLIVYNESIAKDVSPQRIEQFFSRENNEYRIKPEIRSMLIFSRHDLTQNPPYCDMNLISCRNLLIYLTPVLQKKIFLMMHFGLKKNGYLFLGPSENIHPLNAGLELINNKWKIYKNIETKRTALSNTFSLPALTDIKAVPPNNSHRNNYADKKNDLYEMMNEAIINDLGYTVIYVDKDNQVVNTFGDTAKYLIQKNFNLNLTELLAEPLGVAFITASRQALRSDERTVIKGIKIKNNEKNYTVNLQVKHLPEKKGRQKLSYVLLSEDSSPVSSQTENNVFNKEIYINQYNVNLEEELIEVKEKLQLTSDNLDASLENMQSFNEELLSANEEMQSTNEEMQSVNEELQTINSDYQLRNKELAEINDDLNNYFRSNLNGQLFVNTDLLLMKFSPGTVKHINLLDTDIGRPLSNISTNLKFESIENDIKKVIANGGVVTKEVEAENGKFFQLMTMPYIRQADNKAIGAIITFNDISELKKVQDVLKETNKNLVRVNTDLDNFVHAASHDLLGPLGNIEVSISMLNDTECVSDSEVKEYLNIIDVSVKKFKGLIKEMATIGKIESQRSETEPVNVADIVNEIKLSIADRINSSKAAITTDFGVAHIKFSKKNLRSLLYNVVTNAIKYKTPERAPAILISTTKADDYVLLSIKDNGNGIEKDKIDRIFNIYGRIQTDVEGQGIGLYLAKKIVDASGGYISVDSEPGKGSTFNIYFKSEKEAPVTYAEG